MFKIGEFSKLSNITIKMLRHYDKIGILCPSEIDHFTSHRYYIADQLITALKINTYKSLGFSLKMIKVLLESEDDAKMISSYLKLRKIEIEEEQDKLNKQFDKLKKISEKEKNMEMIKYDVLQKAIPARTVLSLRKTIPTYNDESMLWNELYEYMEHRNIAPIYDGYTLAIYHDKEYKDENVDVEIQVTVGDIKNDSANVKFLKTNELSVVSVTFSGSYEQMPNVTQAIANYLEQNSLSISGEMINIFHVSPAQTENEEEYITEACYILKEGD